MARLPLNEMTVAERLDMMEAIWDDLCSQPESVPSPSWHGEVLAERETAVERGDEVPEDWEAAQKRIRRDMATVPPTMRIMR